MTQHRSEIHPLAALLEDLAAQPTLSMVGAARRAALHVAPATVWVRFGEGPWEGEGTPPPEASLASVDELVMASVDLAPEVQTGVLHALHRHAEMLRLREELDVARARYAALRDIPFEGIAVHRDGVILEVNQALADLYGYRREEMIGMDMAQTVDPEVFSKVMAIVRSRAQGAYETSALRKDGTTLPLEARGKDYVFDGQPVRVAAFRDIRDRKAAEAKMRQAQEAAERANLHKSRFLANLSHEIRTPLNAVTGVAELLQWTGLTDRQQRLVGTLVQSADSMVALMDQLLDVSRIDTGELVFEVQPFFLPEVVQSALAIAREPKKGVERTVDLDTAPDALLGDGDRIRQILVNLLENAAKFTPEGTIEVAATAGGAASDRLHVRVTDTGVGIPESFQPRLFDRFVQGGRRDAGGTGLGLYISRELARGMGGDLVVQSEVGRGSTFLLDLPLRTVTAPEGTNESEPRLPAGRVLVVEDKAINQLVTTKLLQLLGQEAVVVDDGEAGVQAALAEAFDLVLMDVRMPVLDGLEATRRLRAQGYTGRVVALTAHAMQEELEACLAAGMDGTLTKPLTLDALRRVLSGAVGG